MNECIFGMHADSNTDLDILTEISRIFLCLSGGLLELFENRIYFTVPSFEKHLVHSIHFHKV